VTLAWPDLVIGAITIFFAVRGFSKGFVSELAGAVAVFVAIVAAFRYNGSLDGIVTSITGLTQGSAHAVGLLIFAIVAYAIVMLVAWLLGRVASLPVVGLINGVLGALLGAGKALFGAFLVLYVVLFFPIPNDLRADLKRSALVSLVAQPDAAVDDAVRGLMPWFVRPLVYPFFVRHHV
jgi:membrane protein required for colicin V production